MNQQEGLVIDLLHFSKVFEIKSDFYCIVLGTCNVVYNKTSFLSPCLKLLARVIELQLQNRALLVCKIDVTKEVSVDLEAAIIIIVSYRGSVL